MTARTAMAGLGVGLMILCGAARVSAAEDARSLYRTGSQAQAAGDWYRAVESYRNALELNPSYLEPMVGLAESFLALGDFEEASRWVAQARKLDRSNPDLAVLQGRIELGLGNVADARALFSQVLSQQPNSAEARFGLAEADLAEGRLPSARDELAQVLKAAPESRRALLSLAMLADSSGDHAAAGRYIETALRGHSDDPQVQLAASDHYASMGRWDLAERYARVALTLAPGSAPALLDVATAQIATGAYGDAADTLRQVVSANPGNATAWYELGLAYVRAADPARAIEALGRAVQARPDDEVPRIVQEDIAIDNLKEGDEVRVKLAVFHVAAGRSLEQQSLLDKAIDEYRRAIMLDPVSRDARLGLARAHRLQGLPGKQLDDLQAMAQLGVKDAGITDQVEALTASLAGTVSRSWDIDQYAIDRLRYRIVVFTVADRNVILHPLASEYLGRFLRENLERFDSLQVPRQATVTTGFDAAFANARGSGADYFALVSIDEAERSFGAVLDLCLARTGARVASWSAFRTGNDRVRDAFEWLAAQLAAALPPRGTLLDRNLDRGLVDLGTAQGIKVGDKLEIVRQTGVALAPSAPGPQWASGDVVGDFTVTAVDEAVSEGTLARRGTFDFINLGDEVLRPQPARPAPAPAAEPVPPLGLLGRLLGLRGR